MHLIIYGPEGSGKGTQAQILSRELNLPVLTSGDLVRKAAEMNNRIGRICRLALESGSYVQDDIMYQLWRDKLKEPQSKKGFILDGFPRNINQAEFLVSYVDKIGYAIDEFIYLNISDNEAYDRLIIRKRKLFPGSRISHDTPGRIRKRLKEYRQMEQELVNYFKNLGILLQVEGNRSVEEVSQAILDFL